MRILRSLLLMVWCGLAMLGHSGIHALAEFSGGCCTLDESYSGIHRHGDGNAHSHAHANCQHHGHSHSKDSDDSSNCPSSHDSQNCRLCDWFLKIGSSFHSVAQVEAFEQVTILSAPSSARPFGDSLPLPLTRGPPALDSDSVSGAPGARLFAASEQRERGLGNERVDSSGSQAFRPC